MFSALILVGNIFLKLLNLSVEFLLLLAKQAFNHFVLCNHTFLLAFQKLVFSLILFDLLLQHILSLFGLLQLASQLGDDSLLLFVFDDAGNRWSAVFGLFLFYHKYAVALLRLAIF